MKIITKKDLGVSLADNTRMILDQMIKEDDGTVYIDLGDGVNFAGMQINYNITDSIADNEEFVFYDFLIDESEKTMQLDEDTTGAYSLDQIEGLIEYRLNKIIDLIE